MVIKNLFLSQLLRCVPTLVLCYTASLQAQSYIADIQKLSVEDGLSSRFVRNICKDSRGFMWMSTSYGLNRYDGYEFKRYTKENSALTSNDIERVHEDDNQNLWIIHQTFADRVIDVLNLRTARIQNFDSIFKTLAPFKARSIIDIYSGPEKTLWFITKAGKLYRYKSQHFEQIDTVSISKQDLIRIVCVNKGFVWVGREIPWTITPDDAPGKLVGIDLKTGMAKTFNFPPGLRAAGMDDHRNLWLFHPKEQTFVKAYWEKQILEPATTLPPEFPDFASSVSFARKHYQNPPGDFIWWISSPEYHPMGFPGFPVAWNLRENIQYDFRDDMTPLLTYKNTPIIYDACLDTENRLWIATDDGILIISLKKNKFTTITNASKNYSARGIVEDHQGILYVNTYNGTLQIHPKKEVLKRSALPEPFPIIKGRRGRLWFGGNPVEQYDPVSGKSRYYSHIPWQLSLMNDTRGRIWIGSEKGLYILEPETDRFRKFTRYNAFTELKKSSVYHMQETEEGIWIAASSGLYLLEPGKGITARYSSEQTQPCFIPYDHILHLYRDNEGILWLATKGGGLIRFNPVTGNFHQFTTVDGLSSNIIYAVYEDEYSKLWLPGNYGLMQFDKQSYRVKTYLKDDGIAHNEFNTGSHYRASDGRLYFGGLAGVTSFHPRDFIAEKPISAPLRLTRCQVLNGETGALTDKTQKTINTRALELSPSDKSLLIEFALLNYKSIQTNSYAYKIEGLDKDWTAIRTNILRLNGLPYGKYTLRIKGQGIGGEQSANVLSINLLVHKPFYLTYGFITGSILTLVLLIYGTFRWRLQRLKKAKIHLQKTVKERTAEIRQQKDKIEQQAEKLSALNATQSRWFNNIAHELRTPLTLIHGPIKRFLKKYPPTFGEDTQDIEMAGKNTKNLLKLVNEIIDISRLEFNQLKLNQRPTHLSRLIRDAAAQFESFARQKGVILSSHIPNDPEMNIDKERIRNILVNLISNALKFTHAGGKVTVSLQNKVEEGIAITVEDTGDGIPEKDLPHIFERYFQVSDPNRMHLGGAGIGLSFSLELARLHGGDIKAQSQPGKGSSFTLILPQSLLIGAIKPVTIPMAVTLPERPANPVVHPSEEQQDKPLILLVEDHPDMRHYIRSFMDERYRVAEATDGMEALDYLKKATPELIISDIMMPRMDGITLAKTLKEDKHLKHLPFITLTARTGEADKIAALRIGIDDYLTKPFNPEELEARATNLIRNYSQRKAVSQIHTEEIIPPGYQDKFIAKTKAFVMERLENNALSVSDLARFHNMSPSSLNRLIKKASGLSPGQFIREIRLQHARKLLEAKHYPTVLEVVYAVGFEKASYFTKVFTERFGKKPSEYL